MRSSTWLRSATATTSINVDSIREGNLASVSRCADSHRAGMQPRRPGPERQNRSPGAKPIAWETIHQLKLSYVNRIPRPPFSALIDHIHQAARIAGVDRLGIGSAFDGVSGRCRMVRIRLPICPQLRQRYWLAVIRSMGAAHFSGAICCASFREVEEIARERHRDYTEG